VVGEAFLRLGVRAAVRSDTPATQIGSDEEDGVGGIDHAVGLAVVVAVVHVGLLADAVAEGVVGRRVGQE
jgi:hypothetical protein